MRAQSFLIATRIRLYGKDQNNDNLFDDELPIRPLDI